MLSSKNIVLADDHELVRKGICNLIEIHEELNVVAQASNGKEVLDYLENNPADLVLLDIEMPVMNGIETIIKIKERWENIPVLMLSMQNNPEMLRQCVAAGAIGYIHKNANPQELHNAITAAINKQPYFSKEAMKMIGTINEVQAGNNQPGILKQLSVRELEVLKLIAQGYSSTVIGNKLFLSPQTIDTHRKNILKKLNLHNVKELTKFAVQHGLSE
jgi:DNA-binding NarL/FixJ family response regulator